MATITPTITGPIPTASNSAPLSGSAAVSASITDAVSLAVSSALASLQSAHSASLASVSSASHHATPTVQSVDQIIASSNGSAQNQEGVSLETFLASLSVAAIVFGVEVLLFVLLRKKMRRIYEPRTYLVPEKRRTPLPEAGFLNFFAPVFETATSDFISKSGLDAYFFLRYLLMLLKTFIIIALCVIPILIPINFIGGKGGDEVQGLDRLAWSNISNKNTHRYWAHLLLAITLVIVFCYMFFDEMRKYIRLRQAYLTSPQHRLRASATSVLVSGIPKSWLTMQRLVELYDVFPGGIRNVWINRDYDDLQEKVTERDWLAKCLEKAETELIVMCKKKQLRDLAKAAKTDPVAAEENERTKTAIEVTPGAGISSGNPHQIPKHLRTLSKDDKRKSHKRGKSQDDKKKKRHSHAIGGALAGIGKGLGGLADNVKDGVKKVTGHDRKDSISSSSDSSDEEGDKFDASAPPGTGHRRSRPASGRPGSRPHVQERLSSHSGHFKRGSTLMAADGAPLVLERTTSGEYANPSSTSTAIPEKDEHNSTHKRQFWKKEAEDDEIPLSHESPTSPTSRKGSVAFGDAIGDTLGGIGDTIVGVFKPKAKEDYPPAFDPAYDGDDWGGTPVWMKYIQPNQRPTMRLPIFSWMPSLPLIGKKVDTIYHCRKELARLNLEIEMDQQTPEKYPLMNSAFIQFNQQAAAHMACQALSHHVPQHMCPRHIEVSPNDVIWGNMKMQWWERYMRSALITVATGGLILGWAFPVAFVGLISQVNYLTDTFTWLRWLSKLPDSVIGLISGVLPPLLLGILMAILPMILRLFARIQGCHTGMAIERAVQGMYFAFLFIQVFLVVSISSGITAVVEQITEQPFKAPEILAVNLPKASNFFFSYLLLQAFSVSGAALLQIATLLVKFIVAPLLDTTAREKFERATTLMEVKWGTFFPVYTNLACIGIVYSVISPLILLFNIITFSLFWTVYRYNLLFVVNFRFDTGGLLFPRAINQLFTGLYVMEACLIGLFFLVRDSNGVVACAPQGIIMIVATVLTVLYQIKLNEAFGPLLTYLPITLEDDAVIRDQEFAKEQDEARKKNLLGKSEVTGEDLNEALERREKLEEEGIELSDLPKAPDAPKSSGDDGSRPQTAVTVNTTNTNQDIESGDFALFDERPPAGDIFQDIADEIEDLTPEERDMLVARAFQHPAIRAKRPVIWIPRDDLGVSDDEIMRTEKLAMGRWIWISNEYAGLNPRGRVRYGRSPPDLDMRDLVEL